MKTNETFLCSTCGETHPLCDQYEVQGDLLCMNCADGLTVVCDHCGERTYEADSVSDSDTVLCQACYDRHFSTCADCGRILRTGTAYYLDGEDDPYCESCYYRHADESALHEYSYVPELQFHGKGSRFFGVELEVDGAGQSSHKAERILEVANREEENLYVKTDGSLDAGLELVTHPMTLDYHLHSMPWAEVLQKARELDYLSHRIGTCGLHVHVARTAFGMHLEQQETAIARLLYFVEKFWAELLRFSRRTESQIRRWAARYGLKLCPLEVLDNAKNSCAGRYAAVNMMNADTVEIRMFRGTLKLNTLLATLQLVNHLCDVAVFLTDEELQALSWFDFLDRIHEPELIQYLRERNLYRNEPITTEEDL